MSLFPKRPHYIGIDVEMSTLKIASVRKRGKKIEVVYVKEVANGENTRLFSSPHNSYKVSALTGPGAIIRTLETPLTKKKEIFSSLEFQVEGMLPFPLEEAEIQAEILEKRERSTLLSIAIAKKQELRAHFEALKRAKIEPDTTTVAAFALASLAKVFPKSSSAQLFIHLGEKQIHCALVKGGGLLKGYSIERNKNFLQEIQKTAIALAHSFDDLCLLGTQDPLLLKQLAEVTGKNVFFAQNPFPSLTSEEFHRYCFAIAIALSHLFSPQFNFRKGEFAYPRPLKKFQGALISYVLLSSCLALSLFLLCKANLHNLIKKVEQKHHLLQAMENKHYPLPLRPMEYHKQLLQMEEEILHKPDTFALYPYVPKVHELFGWFHHLPMKIDLQSFHYTMVSRPTFQQKKEHYLVKVFLEFTTENASDARSFHELLLAPNAYIDPQQEVQWTLTREGRYRAVFYLKDKTRYTT